MELSEEQKKAVAEWAAEGATLREIQSRLQKEFGVKGTYLETRLLVTDLGIELDEWKPAPEEEKVVEDEPTPEPVVNPEGEATPEAQATPGGQQAAGGVQVSLDTVARPGALVSGKVTFTDGNTSVWMLDQAGRLALDPDTPGYRPPESELPEFQKKLQDLLSKSGL